MWQCSYSHRVGGSFETEYGFAPDVGWMASSAVLLVAGCLLCFVFHFSRDVLFSSIFPIVFPLYLLLFYHSSPLFPLYCNSLVCWLASLLFFPLAHRGWHCMANPPCCTCNVIIGLVVCDHISRLSMRHELGHY